MAGKADLSGTWTAIITPFSEDGSRIDTAALERQLEAQKAGNVTGVVVAGTTGESPTLSGPEYAALVEKVVTSAKGLGLRVIVGTGSYSTSHAIDMHKRAAGLGADGSLSVNPYYNKPTQGGLIAHFEAIADSADVPIMLYNIPGRSGVTLTLETIRTLAGHQRIAAVKDATGNVELCARTIASCGDHIQVLSGDDGLTFSMCALGAVGTVSVASNVVPAMVSEMVSKIRGGDLAGGRAAHYKLLGLFEALALETNPIPIKSAMHQAGLDTGSMRLPMTPASPGTVDRLVAELRDVGRM